ncbi:sesquipedalian-1 [Coccinella septempunctata]|uniref:sesquipedalian-1 n=1 Tax=Coccinella septempunctata TaxID=41139 RepID=UPI001D06F8E9|nr:sesquipedalian-1 [Coccinella septempunctata]
MKINEKNLCAYAVSASPIDKEGYLSKKGEVNKSFQKRYFVLRGNLLFYFDKKSDKEPIGVIVLEGCTLELVDDDEPFCFKIDFHGSNSRSYILGTESQESMEQWMKALACSSYDYMKLMVAELQRQLDDIEETPLSPPQHSDSPKPPPRHRHNPFDRVETVSHYNLPPKTTGKQEMKVTSDGTLPGTSHVRISFIELHNSYGRKIMMDYNMWKHQRRLTNDKDEVNLISF